MEREEFLQNVRKTIEDNHLFSVETDKILVGVSGGVDSITLIQVLYELGYNVAIAHCNFQLRGEESDGDQIFVEQFAQNHSIPIHVRSFNTQDFAKEQKESIEMAARNLRYEWFETLCSLHEYTHIAIAHNQNDSIETFFINLLRSAGLKGLTGIPMKNGKIVRPLLNVSRQEIENFIRQTKLQYRVDSTNLTNDYVRNKIRNIILPELRKISPNCMDSIAESIKHLRQSYAIYSGAIEEKKSQFCTKTESGFVIDEQLFLQQVDAEINLFEILYPCNFNPDVISQILKSFESQSGKIFESETHLAVHDRNRLFVEAKKENSTSEIIVKNNDALISVNGSSMEFKTINRKDFVLCKKSSVAMLDLAKLTFPLTIRTWKSGDSFIPFGMKGRKKVSDFLIDAKVPVHEKNKVLIVESNGDIVWLVGFRISQNYAVVESTEKILTINFVKNN